MSAHHNNKEVLGKIGDQYQAYCTSCKTHAMATCHEGTWFPLNRGLDILAEDTEQADIDNDSTHSSDTTVALGDSEAVGHPEGPAHENQDRLTALMREINDLQQRVAAGGGNQQRPWITYSKNCKICQLPSISHSHLHLLNLLGKYYTSTQLG